MSDLDELIRAGTRRVNQENFSWQVGMFCFALVIFGPVLLLVIGAGISGLSDHSDQTYRQMYRQTGEKPHNVSQAEWDAFVKNSHAYFEGDVSLPPANSHSSVNP